MVDPVAGVARLELPAADPQAFFGNEFIGNSGPEGCLHVVGIVGNQGFLHGNHEVGRPEKPALSFIAKHFPGGPLRLVACGRPRIGPCHDGLNFVVGQPTFVGEEAVGVFCGIPRRHLFGLDLSGNSACPRPSFLKRHQRHRCDDASDVLACWPMATLTIFLENRQYVPVERHLFCFSGIGRPNHQCTECREDCK